MGIHGPVNHPTEIEAYTLFLEAGGSITIPTNNEWNFIVYQLGGSTKVNNGVLTGRQLAYFNFEGTEVKFHAQENSRFLLVSGPIINEPLAQYGPFVMNRPQELQQAIDDYQAGKMGKL
jgi:redox-sensitive bicupin YhaK (pirin superfamily)